MHQVIHCHSRTDDYIADYCDGRLFKEHDFFQSNSNALQLVAYFDEVEVCNPLAGRAGIHKLGLLHYEFGFALIKMLFLFRDVLLHAGKSSARTQIDSSFCSINSLC